MIAAMGSAFPVYRLVRFAGAGEGCAHHLLLRAGRPSYPNYSQTADDAAEDLPDVIMTALTDWCRRWYLRRHQSVDCGVDEHAVVGEWPVEVVEPPGGGGVDLDADVGMRSLDVWAAQNDADTMTVIASTSDGDAFWAGVRSEWSDGAPWLKRPGGPLRVLFLTDRSGAGDLREI